jgi:hypothetical protein
MKFIIKLLLSMLFIPIFLVFLLAVTFRFQLLDFSFWQRSFSEGNTYANLSASLRSYIEEKVTAERGSRSDVGVFTDLVSPENLKDVIDKNLAAVLQYMNGESREIVVYVPLDKIPRQFLPQNLGKISQKMPLRDFLREFNMEGPSPSQEAILSSLGRVSWCLLASVAILAVGILILLFLLVEPGEKLLAPGVALNISGAVVIVGGIIGRVFLTGLGGSLLKQPNLAQQMVGSLVPPIALGIVHLWMYFGVFTLLLGLVLFFIKKPRRGSFLSRKN